MPFSGYTVSSGQGRTFGRLHRLKREYIPGLGLLRSNASSFRRVSTFRLLFSLCSVCSSGIGVLSLLRGGISLTGLNAFSRCSLNSSIHVSSSKAFLSGDRRDSSLRIVPSFRVTWFESPKVALRGNFHFRPDAIRCQRMLPF